MLRGYDYSEEDAKEYDKQLEKIAGLFIGSYMSDSDRLRYFTMTRCWVDYGYRKDRDIEYTTRCHKLGQSLHIAMDDKIYPCIYFGDHEMFDIGNISDGVRKESLKEFEKNYFSKVECIDKNKCVNRHCDSCPAADYFLRGEFNKRNENHCKMREIERKWFYLIMKELKPYITDHALRTYWGRVHEQALQSERV